MSKAGIKQQEILQFIQTFIRDNGYAPSVREIGNAVGLSSTATVSYHVSQLREKGLLQSEPGKKRAISAPAPRSSQIPIVGLVTAGVPILAQENQEGYLAWEGDPSCFALRVRGDSMVEAGIFSGDLVVVRPQQTAVDGQIVVAMIEDEATVKTFRRQRGEVWLQPENPAYEPIYAQNLQIVGLVKAVLRYY